MPGKKYIKKQKVELKEEPEFGDREKEHANNSPR